MNIKNPFIVIEALDAGGSQTQTDRLSQRLRHTGYHVLQLHFPQEDRATGKLIYERFLKSKNAAGFSRREQALLYIQDFFSRAEDTSQHLNQTRQNVVISDRFYTSTLAYQTIGLSGKERQDVIKWIKWLCLEKTPALSKPTQVIFLDTPVDISLKHLAKKKKDFFENRQKLTAIRASYVHLAHEEKWTIISSIDDRGQQRSVKDIHQEIWQHVTPLLP